MQRYAHDMGTRSAFATVLLGIVAVSGRAAAQAPASSDQVEAVAEFTAGRALFEAGDCKGAIPHFVASLEKAQSVGARFNLAECSAREGRHADARNHYKVAEQVAIGKADGQRAQLARAAAAELDKQVTTMRVVFRSQAPGATIAIDGVPVEAGERSLLSTGYAVEAGVPHTLVAEAPGRARWERRDIRGEPGGELPPIIVDFAEAGERAHDGSSTSALRTASIVGGGVGVAALVTGGVFTLLATTAKSDAENACASGPGFSYPLMCNPARRDDVRSATDTAKSDAAIATVTFVVGAVVLATATVLLLVSSNKPASSVAKAVLSGVF